MYDIHEDMPLFATSSVQNTETNRRRIAREATSAGCQEAAREAAVQVDGPPEDRPNSSYSRLVKWLPRDQIDNLKQRIKEYLTFEVEKDGDEDEKKEKFLENAKELVRKVMDEFEIDETLSKLKQFSMVIFLHKLIVYELNKHVSFFQIGKVYLGAFTDLLFGFLTSFSSAEFSKIWNAAMNATQNFFNAEMLIGVGLASCACFYLYKNFQK
ncbi:Oidioi.mRNA.OKI2018_I69.chr1.g82.t1.cds [Oikopleura dioica]|uniref:Oidioi.mRNA.OKI2018_I69.chr1.g82.t1.cds n=1 Tax=Oikopleura dioica TaxID=34765 RepID=A0ABN7SKH2_OIKDI|nr:Oidioi.mRNA.OKI2018_I69.chr1.g82.t1.cds [Oikopleura dioica]